MITFLYILLSIVVFFMLLVFLAPRKFHVSREIKISKSSDVVYNYLKQIKNQEQWSPWQKKDDNIKYTYTGIDGEVGFVSHWEGNKDVGVGDQEILTLKENALIETELRFYKPWKSLSNGFFNIEELDVDNTKVTWGFKGISKRPTNVFFLFFNMDKAVGKDFEEGLNELKNILEK